MAKDEKQDIKKVLAEHISNMAYVNAAAILFVQMLNHLETTDALMLRVIESLPADIVAHRCKWELGALANISEHLKECLDVVGNMTNGRDSATEPIIKLCEESLDVLNMVIDKHIKQG